MHKHLVSDIFLFHASIASKLPTDKPTGGHAAKSDHPRPMRPAVRSYYDLTKERTHDWSPRSWGFARVHLQA